MEKPKWNTVRGIPMDPRWVYLSERRDSNVIESFKNRHVCDKTDEPYRKREIG